MADIFLGRPITPLTRRRLRNFRANKRGYWSLWIFLGLFFLALFAEFIANDKPLLVWVDALRDLDLGLDVLDGVVGFHIKGDGLAGRF